MRGRSTRHLGGQDTRLRDSGRGGRFRRWRAPV